MKKKQPAPEDLAELLSKRKYDPNKPPPAEQVVFLIESKNIGTLQNFITITGMQKSGKTTFLSAMIAAGLTRDEKLSIRIRLPEAQQKVAYFDTEQGDYDFFRTMERVKLFCSTDRMPDKLDAYNLREDEPRIICLLIERYLEQNPDCGLLVVDGILDLIESYNDEAESKRLVNWLKRITKQYNLLALLTLHKGKTTANTLGHLGAMADRAAQSILAVEKNKDTNTFILKSDYLRSAEDFTPIEVRFNKEAHTWETCDYQAPEEKQGRASSRPNQVDKDVHAMRVEQIFFLKEYQTYIELEQNIIEFYGVGKKWAKDCIAFLIQQRIIFKTDNGYTNRTQAKLFIQN